MAEWLRRWIANPLLFERVGSNPTIVDELLFLIDISTDYPTYIGSIVSEVNY